MPWRAFKGFLKSTLRTREVCLRRYNKGPETLVPLQTTTPQDFPDFQTHSTKKKRSRWWSVKILLSFLEKDSNVHHLNVSSVLSVLPAEWTTPPLGFFPTGNSACRCFQAVTKACRNNANWTDSNPLGIYHRPGSASAFCHGVMLRLYSSD